MQRITDILTNEHAILRKVFEQIERILPTLSRAQDVHSLADMLDALLQDHADAEEHLLYVTLDHALANIGELESMSQEHGEIDSRIAQARQTGDIDQARRLLLAALKYSRSHFQNEEVKVFPVIQERLSDETLHALGEAWRVRNALTVSALATA